MATEGRGSTSALERWVTARWYAERANPLLVPVSALFRGGVGLRRWLYRRGLRKSVASSVPVIVVGNLTVGGSGKTPVVAWLARRLAERGVRAGIVSRGYGAPVDDEPVAVDGSSDPASCGDEPVLLARLTGAPVCVCTRRDRAVAALAGVVDVVIADDGLQHYRMARDAEIVVLDAERGLGNGKLLPAGPLRESAARLEEADLVLRRGAGADVWLEEEALASVQDPSRTAPLALLDEGRPVVAVAGIGHPERFFESLRTRSGVTLAETRAFPDHWRYTEADFEGLGDARVVMTAKDAVKCRSFAGADWWSLEVATEVAPAAAARVDALLDSVFARRRNPEAP